MFESTQIVGVSRRLLALSVVAAAAAVAGAQAPAVDLKVPAGVSSSSDMFADAAAPKKDMSLAEEANLVNPLKLDAFQYGGGRRGGRPRYRGGNQNADGSSKWTFEAGVGFTAPVQDTGTYLKTSYGFGAGFGRRWSNRLAALFQFDWDNFGFQNSTLQNQLTLYNFDVQQYNLTTACTVQRNCATPYTTLGGSSHVWSFTVDPELTVFGSGHEGMGLYVTGGPGFYHKTANFTTPTTGYCYDYYYGYYQCTGNQTVDKYTSNSIGVNAGAGITYKFSRFSNERLFAEIKYVYVANQNKVGLTASTVTASNYITANQYPANSHQTYYFPVKFGIRF